jgi:hypothetical protein
MLTYALTSYDGDPTLGGAPDSVRLAPKGNFFLQDTGAILWKKNSSTAGDWSVVGGQATQLLTFGVSSTSDTDVTEYIPPGFSIASTTDELGVIVRAGTVNALYVKATTGPLGDVLVFKVRKNGVDQTITATLAISGLTASDTAHSFAVADGDEVTVQCNPGPGITTGAQTVRVTVGLAV